MSVLLLETGAPDNLLLETGDNLLLEGGGGGGPLTQSRLTTSPTLIAGRLAA